MFGQILPSLLAYLVVTFNMQTSLAMIMSILAYQTSTENESGIITFALFDRFFSGEFLSLVLTCCAMISVFSTFYSFIRLFANKRIEYNMNSNKSALVRLFDYSQLKTKQEKTFNKSAPLRLFKRHTILISLTRTQCSLKRKSEAFLSIVERIQSPQHLHSSHHHRR